jgi:3-oxoacyl-[acyl-carrier protein] reductase
MGTLKGKSAFVTGTSQGIGAAIAKELIEKGCNVCMHYFHSAEQPEKLKMAALANGQKALTIPADLTREEEVVRCVKEAVTTFGSFDILVNNSGGLVERRYLPQVDTGYWKILIDINLTSMMLVTKELLPYFNRETGSSIVNISSIAGRKGGHPGSLVYATTKGAMLTWTRALSAELAREGIRVNAIAPGFIEGTAFHRTFTTRESAMKTIEAIPLGHSGNPEDIARAAAYLASEYDGFITGATLDINGGVYCA